MKQLDLSQYVVNEDYSVWPIDFAMSASFEVPLDAVQRALPPGIFALEPRPGLALLNLSVFSFTADTHGLTAPCTEIVASAHIMPNLALAPTLPRMSMFTFNIAATTREFIESPFATDHYPVFPEPIDVQIDRDAIVVEARDREGRPILRLAAAQGVVPRYEQDTFYVQSVTRKDGRTYVAGNVFEFSRAENQRNLATAGGPAAHPFFGDLDVSGVLPRHGYIQMWTEPGQVGRENHFFLRPLT